MKIDLCCGRNKKPGYQGVDVQAFDGVDIVADLNHSWPFKDNSIESVSCNNGLEHLNDIVTTMNELHRVLKPGGTAQIVVPSTNGMGAFQDPTHKTFWNVNTFFYFIKDHPYRAQYPAMIDAEFEVVSLIEAVHVDSGNIPYVHAELRKPNGKHN